MVPIPSKPLTERQAAVMERIDRRVPIKVIAQDLGVSETRINQHIRALKDIYDVTNLGDLVESYRADMKGDEDAASVSDRNIGDFTPATGFSEPVYKKSQVPATVFGFDIGDRDEAATVELEDVLPLIEKAPWLRPGEPKVVPGLLDGEHAVLFRLGAIMAIAFGFLAAVVLAVTAAVTVSEALDGWVSIPASE